MLGLLKLEPSHGYALHQRYETDLSCVWRISLSQVYNILHRLEKQGYIQPAGSESTSHAADRVPFQITRTGEQHFENWMRTPVGPSVRAIRMAFISKLYFARQLSRSDIDDLIAAQRSTIDTHLEELRHKLDSFPKPQVVNRLGLQLRIKQLESLQTWFEETTKDITYSLEREQ